MFTPPPSSSTPPARSMGAGQAFGLIDNPSPAGATARASGFRASGLRAPFVIVSTPPGWSDGPAGERLLDRLFWPDSQSAPCTPAR